MPSAAENSFGSLWSPFRHSPYAIIWTAGHGAQSQHAELFLANARLLLNSGN